MCRYHLGLDGSGSSASASGRSWVCWPTPRSPATIGLHFPAPPAVELGHNFSLVHDDIEDGDRNARQPTNVMGAARIPQAINAGDMLFTLSHRRCTG